jgi:pentatricopeptide repeat protein
MRFLFEDFALDLDLRELRRGSDLVQLEPQAFDLLAYLIRNRMRVVSKDDLLAAVWAGRIVSESALTTRINAVRSAVRDSGAEQRLIRTVPRKGFRFVGAVRDDSATLRPEQPAVHLPDKPSLAVLPFANMSDEREQEYFADGITEDIITALSKWRWFFVIARNSTFAYKGKQVDTKQVGQELGVRYVLEGSIRKAANRVRITAQLIEAATGNHLWAERFDRDLADIFAVQDEITESVVGAIEPELLLVERQRAARKRPDSLDAFDHYLRTMWWFYQFTPEGHAEAERLARRAVELDPTLVQGYVGLARVLNTKMLFGWSENAAADLQANHVAARCAIELDDKDPYAHYALAWYSLLARDHARALAEAKKSVDLTPNFALGYFALGVVRIFLGQFDQAADPFARAMRLSPHEPLMFFFSNFLALGQYHQGHYEEAAKIARAGLAIRPFHVLYRTLAACYGQLGRVEDARAALFEMQRLMPREAEQLWETTNPYIDPAHRAHVIDGLRRAGMPE